MRKEYSKPQLYAESFQMVEHIAIGCTGAAPQTGNSNPFHGAGNCLYMDSDGETYFTLDTTNCANADGQVEPGADLSGLFFCYQGPSGGYATPFHS